MDEFEFHCRILGIERNASAEEVRKAYRELALLLHPDRHGGSKAAKKQFQQLHESYTYLLNNIRNSSQSTGRRSATKQSNQGAPPSRQSAKPNNKDEKPNSQNRILLITQRMLALPIAILVIGCSIYSVYFAFITPGYEPIRNLLLIISPLYLIPIGFKAAVTLFKISTTVKAIVLTTLILGLLGLILAGGWWFFSALASMPGWAAALLVVYAVTSKKKSP